MNSLRQTMLRTPSARTLCAIARAWVACAILLAVGCGAGPDDASSNSSALKPTCGDGTCNGSENCSSCAQDCGSCVGTDTTAPSVSISSPASGSSVSGAIVVSGSANDNVALSKVEFQVDSMSFSVASGLSSWSYSLDTTTLTNANHTLTAKATDTSGNTKTTSVAVGVNNTASVAQTYEAAVLADAPAGYWRLGETSGTTAADASGYGRSGTYVGGVTLNALGALASDSDKAASFDGVDDLVSIAPSAAWSMGTSSFTAEAWVNPSGDTGHGIFNYFYYTGLGSTLHQGWEVKLGGTSGIHSTGRYVWVRLWSQTSSQTTCFTSFALPAGVFSHLAVVVDRALNEVRLYVNGELKESAAITVTGSLDPPSGKTLELGVKRITPQFLTGKLDEAAVYRSALPASRIAAHFEAASANATAVPASFFGMHMMNQANTPNVSYGSQAKAPSVGWCYVERTKGSFNWTYLDSWVDYAASHGKPFVYAHYCLPKWAAKEPATCTCVGGGTTCTVYSCTSTVADIQDWKNWVAAVTARYRDRVPGIKVWEIWNEPYLGSADFTMNAAEFASLANAAVSQIRQTDPSAVILGPSGHASDYDQFWAAGMTHDFDVITTHGYPSLSNPTAESLVAARMDAIKSVMAKYNVSKPIWDTEGSWGTASLTSDQKVAFVARFNLLHWVNGLSRAYWYAWDNSAWGQLMGTTAATAYQETYNWMVGAAFPTGCKLSGSIYTCEVTRPNGYQGLVVWNTSGSSSYTPAISYTHVRDLAGNSSTISPGQAITIGPKPLLLQNQ